MKLNKKNEERLADIKKYVSQLWAGHEYSPYYFTPHGTSHSKKVEEKIHQLIPPAQESFFKEQEKFILLCSAWLHDIGMIPDLFGTEGSINKEKYLEIRNDHHLRSRDYVLENYKKLGLEYEEANAIGELCFFHRKKQDICLCPCLKPNYDCRLLSAILRIADAFQIDRGRVEEFSDLYNLFLTMGMPLSSEFHWIKSFWTREIIHDHEKKCTFVHFYLSETSDFIKDQKEIIDFTLNEIMEEISSCKEVINESGIFYIGNIEYTCESPPPANLRTKINQIISQLKIDYTASASQLASIIGDTIVYIIDSCANEEEIIEEINKYKANVINHIIRLRPVHILIKKINSMIENTLKDDTISDNIKISKIRDKLIILKKDRINAVKKIAEFALPILSDTGSILLFGYSTIVIESMKRMPLKCKEDTDIYICECRSKNQYNFDNKLLYCDGLKYAQSLCEDGFKKVHLIPDVIAGNLIHRDLISKILFGANSIDIRSKRIGHTAGHFSIVHSAETKKIPIYIFADSCKFGPLVPNTEERIGKWFTRDKEIEKIISDHQIQLINPREDLLSIENIKMFITEEGMIAPEKIPKSFIDKILECNEFPC